MNRYSTILRFALFALLLASMLGAMPGLLTLQSRSSSTLSVTSVPSSSPTVDNPEPESTTHASSTTQSIIDCMTGSAQSITDSVTIVGHDSAPGRENPMPTGCLQSQAPIDDVSFVEPYEALMAPSASCPDVPNGEALIAGNPESIIGDDDRVRITGTISYPWCTICKLYIYHPSGDVAVGSGFFVDAYHVLTAGHCVFLHTEEGWPYDAWAQQIIVIPAMNDGYAPYCQAKSTALWSNTAWTDGPDSRFDWGLIMLDRNIGATTGWMQRMTADPTSSIYTEGVFSAGYPGDLDEGLNLYFDFDYGQTADEYNHWYYCDTFGGQSGMPIWRLEGSTRYVLTVHTSGGFESNHGTRLSQWLYDTINDLIDDNPAPADRPDLVDRGQRWSLHWDAVDPDYGDRYGTFSPTLVGPGYTSFTVSCQVSNWGTAASGSSEVSFYASLNDVITSGDYLLGTVSVGSIAPYGSTTVTWTGTFRTGVPTGTYYVGWIIDSGSGVTEIDEGNNNGAIRSYQLSVDATAPTNPTSFLSTPAVNVWTTDNTVLVNWFDASDGSGSGIYGYGLLWSTSPTSIPGMTVNTTGFYTISAPLSDSSTWYLHIRARDNVGNWASGAFHVGPFQIDRTAPSTTYGLSGSVGLNGWYTSPVSVTLKVGDGGSGVYYTRYRIDGGSWQNYTTFFAVSGDYVHTIQYCSIDNVNNIETVRSALVKIDSSEPETSASPAGTMAPNGWYASSVAVTLTASDATSGVSVTMYQIDGGAWQSYTGAFTLITEGNHTISFYSVDVAGNAQVVETTFVALDTTAPTWSPAPANQTLEFGDRFSYDLDAVDPRGVDRWSLNDTTHFAIDALGVVTDVAVLPVGSYGIQVWVNDTCGNIRVSTFKVTVQDTTPPTWATTPANQVIFAGQSLKCQLQARDLSGIGLWTINDTLHFNVDSTGCLTNVGPLGMGVYVLEVTVYDTHSNHLSAIFSVTVQPGLLPPILAVLIAVIVLGFILAIALMLFLRRPQRKKRRR